MRIRPRAAALKTVDVSWAALTLTAATLITSRALFDHHLVPRSVEVAVFVLAAVAAIVRLLIAKQIETG